MTVCISALFTSLMGLPSSLRHTFNEMLSSVLLCNVFTLVISLCAPFDWMLRIMLVIVTFLASVMLMATRRDIMGQFIFSTRLKMLGMDLCTGVMVIAACAMF